ncbi:DTW domain protein [Photobacterium kishitanii]|uniref:tRNA-uridine aminocarboxypropyltransferase n=1 Tax=Photobacterium kishitanii TaxID=318456 RepID=A0AAX0YWM2_9GAMM|nr:DTW domain-containing protein [Photobacterium kishitanii]KJG09267.1 DTW domain protein [Photobacterium kishitanii]KJG56884.1 DTW domain protein [Photobacterium kishitanii]KJG60378.1 DTW domain protein [Photobacterium kishitanii]KJG64657.1 DTW domain protein [Photobacterium kishitanii]KJG68872.1 DTW domain protein [Photobacterium kishitanii]
MSRYCEYCGKAKKACICHWIETITATTEIWILQHPSEIKRAIGTARILSLSLPNSRLWVGEDFSTNDELNRLLAEPERDVYIVYPGEGAVPISSVAAAASNDRLQTVIVLDGTWKKAYKMWQLATNLHHLPLVNLDNADSGNYRIRKSPKEQGVSTVEAGYLALSAFEADNDKFSPLLTTFNHMIDFQIKQMPQGVFEKNYL